MTSSLHELTALEAVNAIRAGQITASAYTNALLSRIEARESEIQAWRHLDPRRARDQAARLDAHGDLKSLPLAGAAVGVKDIIDTADMPTENGTVLDAGRRPSADATVVRLLREAGAVIMGKTVTTELAYMQPARTRNPCHPGHSPGGSSSGSAAAVAACMVPIALGTQTNGSVIRPASFCGLYALKPTNGLFPTDGILEEAATFDTAGVFARSLEDLAAVAQVLAKGGEKGLALPDYLQSAREPRPEARFAFVKTPAWPSAEDDTKAAFAKLAAALGTACEELALPPEFDRAVAHHRTIMLAEIALNLGRYYDQGKDRLSAVMRGAIEAGRALSAADYAGAIRERERLYRRLEDLAAPCDAILTPSSTGPAPLGFETTGNPIFSTLWTFLGVPALNLPLLTVNGLPLGVQLTRLRFEEDRLFRAAARLCEATS
jgi:Asp-tRNA(Asn)/Glu-tRNA(Gln) amidotransferase A subunit family amidase